MLLLSVLFWLVVCLLYLRLYCRLAAVFCMSYIIMYDYYYYLCSMS